MLIGTGVNRVQLHLVVGIILIVVGGLDLLAGVILIAAFAAFGIYSSGIGALISGAILLTVGIVNVVYSRRIVQVPVQQAIIVQPQPTVMVTTQPVMVQQQPVIVTETTTVQYQ